MGQGSYVMEWLVLIAAVPVPNPGILQYIGMATNVALALWYGYRLRGQSGRRLIENALGIPVFLALVVFYLYI